METQANPPADILTVAAWAEQNKKQLLTAGAILLVVGAIIGIYFWHDNYVTAQADAALDRVVVPADGSALDPAALIGLANQYPSTTAAARALLLAAARQFDLGNFDQAQATFQRFLAEHHDYPLAGQAAIGLAACLEAQGKIPEAISRYQEILNHPSDPTLVQAQLALGRLYALQAKPDEAFRMDATVLQGAQNGNENSFTVEARVQLTDLLAKNPDFAAKVRQQEQQQLQQQQQQLRQLQAPGAPATAPAPTLSTNQSK